MNLILIYSKNLIKENLNMIKNKIKIKFI